MISTKRHVCYSHPMITALLVGSLFSSASQATIVFDGIFSDPGNTPAFYQSYAYGTALLESGGFTTDMGNGTLYGSTIAPSPLSTNSTFSVNGANIHAKASTVANGFFSARNDAALDITNIADENGYYAIGAYGSRTSVTFYSPQALADRAEFHWVVSGAESSNNPATCLLPGLFLDCATGRLDFLATTDTNLTFNDLFVAANNPLNQFGPGSYTYNIGGMPLDQTISLMYWTSAFVTLNASQTTQGGTYSKFADYSNTFDLAAIDLFDVRGNKITEWIMTDLATGIPVFNQNGRIGATDVPEPATLALFALGFAAFATRRRIASLRTPVRS